MGMLLPLASLVWILLPDAALGVVAAVPVNHAIRWHRLGMLLTVVGVASDLGEHWKATRSIFDAVKKDLRSLAINIVSGAIAITDGELVAVA